MKLTWYGRELAQATWQDMARRMRYVGAMLEADIKKSMVRGTGISYSRGSAYTTRWSKSVGRSGGRSGRKVKKSASARRWHVASAPGHPPAVDTGRLRSSITWALSDGSGSSVGPKAMDGDGMTTPPSSEHSLVLVVGSNVSYSKYLELGTRKMAARPFIRPAFNRNQQKIQTVLGESAINVGAGGEDVTPGRSGGISF